MDIKAGIKTTEFWTSLIVQILGLLAVFGVFTPQEVSETSNAALQIVGGLMTVISNVGYSISRAKVKSVQK